eukprot:234870_1
MSWEHKKIKQWSTTDLCQWVRSIELSDKRQATMIQAIKNDGHTGQDWFAIKNPKELANSLDITQPILAMKVYREFKKMKNKQYGKKLKPTSPDENKFEQKGFDLQMKQQGRYWVIPQKVTANTTVLRVKELYRAAVPHIKNHYPLSMIILWSCAKELAHNKTLGQCNITDYRHDITVTHIDRAVDRDETDYWKEERKNSYQHKPNVNNCTFMKDDDAKEKQCAIFEQLKKHKYSEKALEHMETYNHCELISIVCKHGTECKAYKRLVEGGNRLDDRCHLFVYIHPPRVARRRSNLPNGFNQFVFHKLNYTYEESVWDNRNKLQIEEKSENELLALLMKEVKTNQFGNDLILPSGNSIIDIVDEKLKHKRHIAMGSPLNKPLMLAVILYTGCDCNYDLCSSQRNNNYKKWVILDYCLQKAVETLSEAEYGYFPVYTGVGNAMMEWKGKDIEQWGALCTFTSTTWDKEVAKAFCGPQGMMIALQSQFRIDGCDVSWISKFPNEKEILFPPAISTSFRCVSQKNKMQYIVGGNQPNLNLF